MSTCIHNGQLEADILSILKAHLDPKDLSGFLAELKDAEAYEKIVLREPQQQPVDGENGTSRVGERLDHLITFLKGRVSETETCDALLEIGSAFKRYGDLHRAEELFTCILSNGLTMKDERYVGEAHLGRGEVYCLLGRWKDSVTDLNRSRRIFTRMKEHSLLGKVENIIGTGYAEQGKLWEARRHFRLALEMFERVEEKQMTGMALMNLGIVQNIMGQYDVALAQYNRAKPYFEGTGNLVRLAELHHNIGMSYALKSSFTEAFREFDISICLSTRIGNMNLLGLAMLGKAQCLFQLRDFSMALKLIAQAMGCFNASHDRLSLADAYRVRGMIHRELGKFRYAEVCLRTSLRINQELDNRLNIAETTFEIGVLECKRGRTKEAMNDFCGALQCFKKVGALKEVARVETIMNKMREKENASQ